MTTRLMIEIEGDLPADRRYALLAAAETEVADWVKSFNERHKMSVKATVRDVRPGKGKSNGSTGTQEIPALTADDVRAAHRGGCAKAQGLCPLGQRAPQDF